MEVIVILLNLGTLLPPSTILCEDKINAIFFKNTILAIDVAFKFSTTKRSLQVLHLND